MHIWSAPELSTMTGESDVTAPPLKFRRLATSLHAFGLTPGISPATTALLNNNEVVWDVGDLYQLRHICLYSLGGGVQPNYCQLLPMPIWREKKEK